MPLTATLICLAQIVKPKTQIVLNGNDPIDLLNGTEIRGFDQFQVDYLRFKYLFSSPENRDKFMADPEKYAVQDGGACGKMGVLTGKGAPHRYAVIRDRIYLFASDGCRSGVVANPEPYFKKRPTYPDASAKSKLHGRKLFSQLRGAHGLKSGASVPAVSTTTETPYVSNGKNLVWIEGTTFLNLNSLSLWWGNKSNPGFYAVHNGQAIEGTYAEHYSMSPSETRALVASFLRQPLGVLACPESAVHSVIVNEDSKSVGLILTYQSITTEVFLNSKTGLVDFVRFTDNVSGPIQTAEIRFSEYKRVAGVLLPQATETRVDGGQWGAKVSLSSIKPASKNQELFLKVFK